MSSAGNTQPPLATMKNADPVDPAGQPAVTTSLSSKLRGAMGFFSIANLTESMKDPMKDVPLGMMIMFGITRMALLAVWYDRYSTYTTAQIMGEAAITILLPAVAFFLFTHITLTMDKIRSTPATNVKSAECDGLSTIITSAWSKVWTVLDPAKSEEFLIALIFFMWGAIWGRDCYNFADIKKISDMICFILSIVTVNGFRLRVQTPITRITSSIILATSSLLLGVALHAFGPKREIFDIIRQESEQPGREFNFDFLKVTSWIWAERLCYFVAAREVLRVVFQMCLTKARQASTTNGEKSKKEST